MVGFGEGLLKGWQAIDTKIADILLKCVNISLTKVGIQTCSEEVNQILLAETIAFQSQYRLDKLSQRMVRHGFAFTKIERNLVLVKNGL